VGDFVRLIESRIENTEQQNANILMQKVAVISRDLRRGCLCLNLQQAISKGRSSSGVASGTLPVTTPEGAFTEMTVGVALRHVSEFLPSTV